MPRSSRRSRPGENLKIPASEELLGTDLATWAGRRIAAGGRKDALLGRVETLHLSLDGCRVEARVRGNRPLPYQVEVWAADLSLQSNCTCSRESPGPCKHAVAAVEALRFPLRRLPNGSVRRGVGGRAGRGRGRVVRRPPPVPGFVVLGCSDRTRTRDERLADAEAEERAGRRQRARGERARVERVEGEIPRFSVVRRRGGEAQLVTLRDAARDRWSCDCRDFHENEIQTCRHVERVRSSRAGRKGVREFDGLRLLSLWVLPRPCHDLALELLREIRIDGPDGRETDGLGDYFDAGGWLRPAPDGTVGSEWARRAVLGAREAALRAGWRTDVDPAVERRIAEVRAREALVERLAATAGDEALWDRVRSRLGLVLHPYQVEGVRFLVSHGRAFLADDMGLGKTVQAVVAALMLRAGVGARRAMVVCPASLKHQWCSEIAKACGEQARVVEGPRKSRDQIYRGWRDGFLILNYELVLRDLDRIREIDVDLVVLDEAQRIKNWETKTARAVKRLESPLAFVLTGTPLENRLLELHSLAEFLSNRALGPRWRLLPFHAVTDARGRIIAYEALDVLRRRLRGFLLRRERSAVLDQLPPRTDNTFWTGLSAAQRRPYRRHARRAASLLALGRPLIPQEVRSLLQALTSMRILCNAFAQYDWARFEPRLAEPTASDPVELRRMASPKLEEFSRVIEDLLDDSGQKVVVFSQWLRMLRLAHFYVRDALDQRDLRAELFYGGLSGRERSEMLEAFRADPEFRVLFSTDAGGLGLNLQEASVVVNLEVPWNPAVLEQRVGRVHRLGQRRSVQVLHFVTRGAIEERVRQVVESKRELFDGLLVDEADEIVFDESARAGFLSRIRSVLGQQQPAT